MRSYHALSIVGVMLWLLDSSNVGIGTTSPNSKFHVVADNSTIATFESIGSNANSKTFIVQSGGDRVIFDIKEATGGAAADLAFELGDSEVMRLADTGNVGIGTTSPGAKLEVNGDGTNTGGIALREGTNQVHYIYTDGPYQYNTIGSSSPNWRWGQQGGDVKMALNNNGLGIGTTSPSANLHIAGGVTILGQNKIDGGSDNLKIMSDYANVSGSSTIEFSVDASEKMRITSAGNVGIGTTSPLNKLSVIARNNTGYYQTNTPIAVFQGDAPAILVANDANVSNGASEIRLGNAHSTYYPYSAYIKGLQGSGNR